MNRPLISRWLPLAVLAFAPLAHAQLLTDTQPKTVQSVLESVNRYCSGCHKVPSPSVMPKSGWPRVVQGMADMAASKAGHEAIPADVVRDITALYVGSSPASLPRLPYFTREGSPLTFGMTELGEKSAVPLILNINATPLHDDTTPGFIICDGAGKKVVLLQKKGRAWHETALADIDIPLHTDVADIDGDGYKDIIVADLGTFPPSPALTGKVVLLRQLPSGKFEKQVLLDKVGRVTDARAMDIDNDGDLDIGVAIFGGGDVGELAWLENLGGGKFVPHRILKVTGALNLSPVDLDNDGKIDFVSLIAQQHEAVVAFMNKGQGSFAYTALYRGPHPMFGSTSMKVIDMDGDKDPDILFTNGDALDYQPDPKPYHGVEWLENKGNLTFEFRDIGRFYGTAIADAGDLDGDGDMDVVAGSWLNYWDDPQRQSLVWFENDGAQNFTPHAIISRPAGVVSLALADVNHDQRPDIVAGIFELDLLGEFVKKDGADQGAQDMAQNTAKPAKSALKPRLILLQGELAKPAH